MADIQFGFCIPAESRDPSRRASWVADIDRALTLVTEHFDSAWITDHLMFAGTDVLEGFTALTYLAARHPLLTFGHAVLCQSFRNPALLAKMAATLQVMSGGRYILGLGAGWHADEYRAYGYEFPSGRVRVEQLEETLQIVKALWTQDTVKFEGKHFRVSDARCEPKPDPLPKVMVGAFKPKMLRLAARYADEWNVSSLSPGAYRDIAEAFERACAEVEREPSTVRRSWIGGCACAPSQAQAEGFTEGRWRSDDPDDFGFVGTPEQVIDQMQPFVAMGVRRFILDCGGFPDLTTLELLITRVLPALRRD